MCGIAGLVDLAGQQPFEPRRVRAMADAITHRGPDEDGYFERPGLSLASRRLSIVGLGDGRQPIANEDGNVHVVFNGEFFDHQDLRRDLQARGHVFTTHADTEVLPHLWEEYQENLFAHLKGQFAFALWDERRRVLILARDRLGICPLYWSEQRGPSGHVLLFASEIKSLLASGLVDASPDVRGIDQTMTFFALPGPVTCFEGINALLPGHYLKLQFSDTGAPARVTDHTYWEIDFPDRGHESRHGDIEALVDQYEALALRGVERRLRADVPVVSYLSGGVDSSLVLAMASRISGKELTAFTLQIKAKGLDETAKAAHTAQSVGAKSVMIPVGMSEILGAYPRLIQAAECPVSDTSCAALLLLAHNVHGHGYKVALTGEGADETLAGYPWFKTHKMMALFDRVPGLPLGRMIRRGAVRAIGAKPYSNAYDAATERALGGYHAFQDLYGLVSLSKPRFYGERLRPLLGSYIPYSDLGLNVERMKRWHPLNQSLYLGQRIHLPGLLLSLAGDRVAMHSSLETRYPFLDEDVVTFLAGIDPRLKLRGFQDKYLLRRLAERWLPRDIAWRPKKMFRAPFDLFSVEHAAPYVEQLLSERALRETGYFDPASVRLWLARLPSMRRGMPQRALVEHGLAGVAMTQLWHHQFIGDLGADVARLERPAISVAA